MADPVIPLYLKSLTSAGNFGMWWMYYQQFDGQFLEPESRRSALAFLEDFDTLVACDETIRAAFVNRPIGKMARRLREWASDLERKNFSVYDLGRANVLLFLTLFRCEIESHFGSSSSGPSQTLPPDMARRLENHLKWRGHFPLLKERADPQEVMERACRSPTITVVGDIRRSQDLMTYAIDERDFSKRMVEFISETRVALNKYSGFFDKFTGDGFIGHFNESICELSGTNYIDCFVGFVTEFTTFCNYHFREWVKFVRKLPNQSIGLAVGADLGRISFQSLDYHVVAVGEAIVWATRMAAAAEAEEILVNNMLYQSLRYRDELVFEGRSSSTKSGEGFLAWKLCLHSSQPPAEVLGGEIARAPALTT